MSNMEEPNNTPGKQERNKTVMNIGKARGGGGGGIGVGIIFLGGAVATAAFLFARRQRKSSNSKNCNKDQSTASAEIPYKFIKDKYMNEDKGLRFVVANSNPHMDTDQNLRNGTSNSGVHEIDITMISDEPSFLQDEKDNLEVNGRNDILIADDGQDVIHFISPKVLDSSMQFNASALKEKEFPLPIVVEDKTLLQPTIVENQLGMQEFEKVKVDNADGIALVGQGIEEDNQDMLVNTGGEKMDANFWEEENMGQLESKQAAEKTTADQSMLVVDGGLKTSEFVGEGSSLSNDEIIENHCEESASNGNSLLTRIEFVAEGTFQQLSGDSSLPKDENIDNECEESELAIKIAAEEKDEELEAASEEHDKGDTKTRIIEVDDSLCPADFGTNETNEKLDACCEDQGTEATTNLRFAEVEEKCNPYDCSLTIKSKENEALEVTSEFQDEGNAAILMPEEGENLTTREVGLPISEAMEAAEEVKVHEEAEGKEETEILLVAEEKRDQHYAKMTGEQSQETRETDQLPDNNASGSNNQMLQIDTTETSLNGYQEDNSASDEPTSESEDNSANVPIASLTLLPNLKPEIRIDNGFKEVQQSVEAIDVRKETVVSEPGPKDRFVESEDLTMHLAEKQEKQGYLKDDCGGTLEESEDAVQLGYESNVTTEEHKIKRSEEDPNDDTDETNSADKVEEISEGTGDDSAESNAEPIWPAELIQDLAMELEKMEEDNSQLAKEEQSVEQQVDLYLKKVDNHVIGEDRIQKGDDDKGSLKFTLFEKYVLQLAKLTHQTTNSQKKRILTLTIMVLSGSLCTWHFGLPFLKICLIIILIMVITMMHGL